MKKNLKEEILRKIKKGDIKVRPKIYFQVIKSTLFVLLTALLFFSVFVINMFFYLPRRKGVIPMSQGFWESFPWLLLVIGSLVVGLLIYLYRNYGGGYKKHLGILILVISVSVLFSGFVLARSNLNERLERGPRFRRFYDWNEDNWGRRRPGPRRNPNHVPRFQNN